MKMSLLAPPLLALTLVSGSAAARPAAKPLSVRQEPRGIGNLLASGDRAKVVYTVNSPGVRAPQGALFVRNDLTRSFRRVPLTRQRLPGAPTLSAPLPKNLIAGRRVSYYAVIRDPKSGRAVTVPTAGARHPQRAWVMQKPVVVRLGRHVFGQYQRPEALVARAGPDQVGFENNEQYHFGPQTFLVAPDRSIWLNDGPDWRLLVWQPDQPDTISRSIQLSFFAGANDIAFGPADTLYVTQSEGGGFAARLWLRRITTSGQLIWKTRLYGSLFTSDTFILGGNVQLRTGPDGRLYCLVGMNSLPGGSPGWMPVASADGKPLSSSAQRRGTLWPYRPTAGKTRLLSEAYLPHEDQAPHELRYALLDSRGRMIRSWRILSQTDENFTTPFTTELVGGDPAVALEMSARGNADWEYLILRLGPKGITTSFSIPRLVWGSHTLSDLRIGPDGKLYQLTTSPEAGIAIYRYSLAPRSG